MRSRSKILLGAAVVASFMIAACDPALAVDSTESRGPLGKADATGSCADDDGSACGGKSSGTCWCDDQCAQFGDCCSDYAAVCEDDGPPPDTANCTFETCSLVGEIVPVQSWSPDWPRWLGTALVDGQPMLFASMDSGTDRVYAGRRSPGGQWTATQVPGTRPFEVTSLPDGTVCLAASDPIRLWCSSGGAWVERSFSGMRATGLQELVADADGEPTPVASAANDDPNAWQVRHAAKKGIARSPTGELAFAGAHERDLWVETSNGRRTMLHTNTRAWGNVGVEYDGSGRIFVVHYDWQTEQLRMNWRDSAGTWRAADITQADTRGQRSLVALARHPDGSVWMAEMVAENLRLYRLSEGGLARIESVAMVGDIVPDSDHALELQFDAAGRPHIVTSEVLTGGFPRYGYYRLN